MKLALLRRRRGLAVAALLAGLSACGGGGGGGSSAVAPAVIDSANAAGITRAVIDVGLGAGAFGVAVGGGGILSADGGSNALAQGMGRRRATVQQVQPAASVGPEDFDCLVSGTVRLSGSLESDVTLTPGDQLTIEFSNCDDADGAIYDGRMGIGITTFSGDVFNDSYALRAAVVLTDLAITKEGITAVGDGNLDLELDLTVPLMSDLTVSGALLEVRSGSDAWALRDFAVTVSADSTGAALLTRSSGTGTLEGAGFEGGVDFVTVRPLVAISDNYPGTGEVLITGANGATIRATALDAVTLQLGIDLEGDGVVDDTQQIPWSDARGP